MARKVTPAWNWSDHATPINNYEIEGQQDLDSSEIYKILGLGNGSHLERANDPIFAISRALNQYQNQAYPAHEPNFSEREAVLVELQKRSDALSDAFKKLGENNFYEIEDSIARGLNQEPSAASAGEGYVSREISFFREFSTDGAREIARLLKIAAKAFREAPDAPKKGRPPKTALVVLIQELAEIYENHTHQDAYEGFYYDPDTREYDSGFFQFIWAVISKFDPEAAKSNNALGTQIRKALSEEELEKNALEMQVFFESDPL